METFGNHMLHNIAWTSVAFFSYGKVAGCVVPFGKLEGCDKSSTMETRFHCYEMWLFRSSGSGAVPFSVQEGAFDGVVHFFRFDLARVVVRADDWLRGRLLYQAMFGSDCGKWHCV